MYLLDIEKLHPGDIILSREKTLQSKGVRAVTGRTFSHAALYVGGGSYIHADGQGVHAANIQRWLISKPEDVSVLRSKEPVTAQAACDHARENVGTQYSVPEAIRTKLGGTTETKQKNRQFCSRLVAQSYANAGLLLVECPDYCTPNELFESSDMTLVPECVREAAEAEIMFAKSESPIDKQTRITNHIFKQSRIVASKDIQTFSQLLEFVLTNPEHDEAISDIVAKSGYLDLWKEDTLKNPWRYRGEVFLVAPLQRDELLRRAHKEIEYAECDRERYMKIYGLFSAQRKHCDLKLVIMMAQLYLTLIQLCKVRINASQYVLQNA